MLVRGRVSVYAQRGQLQLVAETMEPVGAGSLQLAFEQLKERLKTEGLFDTARKRPLPTFPRTVGIVTSPTGAVIRDFLNIVGRRHAGLNVMVFPAAVQGEQAPGEIESALAGLNASGMVDLIVMARGGGSLEDLAAFNSERVARAIVASALPVVSAVGHETDFTIADFVADLRAPTPSAAAELITEAQHRVAERVEAQAESAGTRGAIPSNACAPACWTMCLLDRAERRLTGTLHRLDQRLDDLGFRAEASMSGLVRARQREVAGLPPMCCTTIRASSLARTRERLGSCRNAPGTLAGTRLCKDRRPGWTPWMPACARCRRLAVLDRGYALVQSGDGVVIRSASRVAQATASGPRTEGRRVHKPVNEVSGKKTKK